MAAKKCPECGKKNLHFFTHCVDCGAKLDIDTKRAEKINTYLKTGLILGVSLVLLIFVILPAVRYSQSAGQNFSEAVSAKSADDVKNIPEFSLNQPVVNRDLQITVISAHDGENTYNSNKFFIVTVSVRNTATGRNIQITNSDFAVIDSEGTQYFPYGIGSKVMYDLSPGQGASADLTYVIPQKVMGKKIQFTYPETSGLISSRDVVMFGI